MSSEAKLLKKNLLSRAARGKTSAMRNFLYESMAVMVNNGTSMKWLDCPAVVGCVAEIENGGTKR